MTVRRSAFLVLTLFAFAFAGCGGRNAALLPQYASQASNASFAPRAAGTQALVTFTFVVSAKAAEDRPGLQHQRFISASTKSVQIAVYKADSLHVPKTLLATYYVKTVAGAAGCKPSARGTRTCTAKVELPTPAVDLALKTYDALPAGGKIPSTAKQLGAGAFSDVAVKAGKTFKLVVGGIPKSISLTLPHAVLGAHGIATSSIHGVAPSNNAMSLIAADADGNAILTDAYVNASGKPVSIAMTVSASAKTCGSASLEAGTATGASIAISAPPAKGVIFQYGATGVAQVFSASNPCTFSIAAKLAGFAAQQGIFALTGPVLTEYALSGTNHLPQGIITGPDGNIWFADYDAIGRVDVSTKAITEFPVTGSMQTVATGKDGNIWFLGYGQLGSITTSGTVVNNYAVSIGSSSQFSRQLAVSPDGNFWFADTEGQLYAKVTPQGAGTPITPLNTASPYPVGVALGPDGNMWFTDCVGGTIERIAPSATVPSAKFSAAPAGSSQQGYPTFLVTGPDGNLWFSSCPARSISKMTTSGTVTSFPVPPESPSAVVQAWGIAVGPDGAIWFADVSTVTGGVGRVPTDITSPSQIAEFHVPSGHQPQFVAAGTDGAIWFTETSVASKSGNQTFIGRLSL